MVSVVIVAEEDVVKNPAAVGVSLAVSTFRSQFRFLFMLTIIMDTMVLIMVGITMDGIMVVDMDTGMVTVTTDQVDQVDRMVSNFTKMDE